jgi:hypothetical protein
MSNYPLVLHCFEKPDDMEYLYNSEERTRYIDMVIRLITQDGLTTGEFALYRILRDKVDPDEILETELTEAWEMAETDDITSLVLPPLEDPVPTHNPKTRTSPNVKSFLFLSAICLGLLVIGRS